MPKSKKKSCPFPRKPLGVKRNHLASLYSNIPSDRGDLKNGHVLQLFFEHERSAPETLRVLSCLPCTQSKIKIHHIRRIVKKYEAFKQQKRKNENETFMHFCSETLTCELGSLCPEPLDTSMPSMSNSSQAGPMSSPMLHVSPMDTQVQLSPEPSDCGTSKCTPVQEQPPRSDPLTAQIGTSSPQEVQVQQHALLSEPGPSKRTSSQMIDTGLTVSAGIPEEPLTSPLPAQIETPGLAVPISQAPSPSSSIRESRRKAPQTPRKSKLKRRLAFSTVSRMAERKTHKEKIKTLRDNLKDQRVKIKEVKHLKQNIKRKSELLKKKDLQIKQLNKELRAPKAESNPDIADELRTSKREVKRLKRENKTIKDRLKLSCDCFIETVKLKDEIKMKNDTITSLQYENVKLEEQLDARKESYTKTFEPEGRRFPLEVRRFVYDCIINQLPTTNVPAIVRKAGERFGFSIKAPGRSAVEFMVRELGIVSDYMVAEYILGHENLTLGFDATTQEGVHINEIHITSANNCLVVDIEQLPGGTTEDYEIHIVDSFNRVAEVYAAFESNNYEEVRQNIISNLKNTMTDRVAVNHSTISRLEETWGVALNELNCHLHPLDTVASTCRAALKNGEDTKGKLYGTDCIAANLVLAINKVRFKDGKGDPKGFVAFLDQEGLPKGLLPRYRGNRLHVLFHISGKLICYYDSFLKFFSSTTVSCGGLLGLILCDFTSTAAQVELQVLGLLGKLLTGPWMRAFYTAGGAQSVSHIDGIDVVRNIISRIKTAITMPMDTLTMRKDFLEQELNADEDRVLQKLQSKPADEEMFAKMMVACMSKIVEVLERQYRRYFDLDITDKLREETESTRCHNIDAEEVMGMFSAAKEHAPNATLCFLSSKIRAQKNRASEYLDGLSLEKREQVVAFSIPRGREQRKSKRKKNHEIKEEIQCRIAAKAHKRETYQRHKLERKLKCADLDISVEFKDRDADFQEILKNILEGRIVGHRICHIWHEDAVKVVYSGKVEKLKKKSGGTYVVSYWNESDGEKYEDAIDYDISKVAFAADFIMEDLVIS